MPFIISAGYIAIICPLNIINQSELNYLRPLSAVFILNIVFLIAQGKRSIQYVLILIALLSLPEINKDVQYNAAIRTKYSQYYRSNEAYKTYDLIKEYRSEKDIITVQLPNGLSLYEDLYLMPLISKEGKPIRYNMTYYKGASKKSLFITHYFGEPQGK